MNMSADKKSWPEVKHIILWQVSVHKLAFLIHSSHVFHTVHIRLAHFWFTELCIFETRCSLHVCTSTCMSMSTWMHACMCAYTCEMRISKVNAVYVCARGMYEFIFLMYDHVWVYAQSLQYAWIEQTWNGATRQHACVSLQCVHTRIFTHTHTHIVSKDFTTQMHAQGYIHSKVPRKSCHVT